MVAWPATIALEAAASWIALLLPAGQGLRGDAGVAGQRGDRGVPGVAEQGGVVSTVLGGVGERAVPQLVKRPAAPPLQLRRIGDARVGQGPGGLLEQLGGAAVRQSG